LRMLHEVTVVVGLKVVVALVRRRGKVESFVAIPVEYRAHVPGPEEVFFATIPSGEWAVTGAIPMVSATARRAPLVVT